MTALEQANNRINAYYHQWQRRKWMELLIYALSISAVIGSISMIFSWLNRFDMFWFLPLILVGSFTLLFFFLKPLRHAQSQLIASLNSQFLDLEHSAHLLWPGYVFANNIESLQAARIAPKLIQQRRKLAWKNLAFQDVFTFFICLMMLYFSSKFTSGAFGRVSETEEEKWEKSTLAIDSAAENTSVRDLEWTWRVSPPRYTGLPAYTAVWKDDKMEVPEGSEISFSIKGMENGENLWANPTFDLKKKKTQSSIDFSWLAINNQLFQWQIRDENESLIWQSAWYQISLISDKKPGIQMKEKELYHFPKFETDWQLEVQAEIWDDYGLEEAQLVLTIARGRGESVKFREKSMPLKSWRKGDKKANVSAKLRAKDLALEAGDELYFYLQVSDNKSPNPQQTRSDTYFYQFQSPDQEVATMDGGLGVNLLPEYFRSQRQIIIDTEKLIAEEKSLSKEAFQQKSNELGIDQKLLRLRYGKFIGEEFESGIGHVGGFSAKSLANDQHHDHDHDHDHEHEHDHDHEEHDHHEHDHTGHDHHDHDHEEEESGVFGKGSGISTGDFHAHDSYEEATFLDEGLKTKLKAALAQMWEAELRLRTHAPKAALPYEYRALELIKEIQQEARVYVERVGFDPPPIKVAEKRMTGELKDAENPRWEEQISLEEKDFVLAWIQTLDASLYASRKPSINHKELATYLAEKIRVGEPIPLEVLRIANVDASQWAIDEITLLKQTLQSILPRPGGEIRNMQGQNSTIKSLYFQKLLNP